MLESQIESILFATNKNNLDRYITLSSGESEADAKVFQKKVYFLCKRGNSEKRIELRKKIEI